MCHETSYSVFFQFSTKQSKNPWGADLNDYTRLPFIFLFKKKWNSTKPFLYSDTVFEQLASLTPVKALRFKMSTGHVFT